VNILIGKVSFMSNVFNCRKFEVYMFLDSFNKNRPPDLHFGESPPQNSYPKSLSKVEEPIPYTLRFRTTKESELDMNFF
jgi:hypothetical protein